MNIKEQRESLEAEMSGYVCDFHPNKPAQVLGLSPQPPQVGYWCFNMGYCCDAFEMKIARLRNKGE